MTEIMEKYGNAISGEMLQSKFQKLAKEHFGANIRSEFDSINSIKESIRFFSLDLPPEIKEIFIPYTEAPIFWIYESSILSQIEDFMKFNMVRGSFNELHRSIKENYSRWVTTKLKSEKEYYSNTTINFIERDINKHNFFKHILKGIVFTYQSSYFSPIKALEQFNTALEIVNTVRINDNIKNELRYIINLYIGFMHIKENDYDKADIVFKEALEIKPQGTTAKFYCALSEFNLEHEDVCDYYLREIFNFDIHRLTIALKTNNSGMFSYFIRNANFYNVFIEKDFYRAFNYIEKILNEHKNPTSKILAESKEKLEKLKAKKYEEFHDDEVKKSIVFVDKLILTYTNTTNTILVAVFPAIQNKVEAIIDSIIQKVKKKHYHEVSEKLRSYDLHITENLNSEKRLTGELENYKQKSKEILAETLSQIEENFKLDVVSLEARVEELPHIDRFNPRASMSNNMMYNVIIAFIVFFIGGVAGYSNKMVQDVSEFNSIFTFVLISGSKWGAISFIIGMVISVIISGIVVLDRYDEKQRIQKRINLIKLERERTIRDLKETTAQKDKAMTESFNRSIAQHKKNIEELKEQRTQIEKNLLHEADQIMKPILDELKSHSFHIG